MTMDSSLAYTDTARAIFFLLLKSLVFSIALKCSPTRLNLNSKGTSEDFSTSGHNRFAVDEIYVLFHKIS